ncbi:hypothetical protein [Polymorphum gilvum]|uniref:Uncharacterized protein n=1 Tax=Polymorphum gilvum (strain LMG 25793 / CGMCC 1.9160 / SL003B-26A1) TaxID=991905 RepID=F2J289_POLGS|nr:hypothetical protein [Polymorphum gilvum]ADZ69785.1 hypothetical protein SL003B_1357 [Polymorphum gilvum SL003B-26A1]
MAIHERGTTVLSNGTGAGWFIAGALIVALIGGALVLALDVFERGDTLSIELEMPRVDVPKVELPEVDVPTLDVPPADLRD